MQFYSVRWKVCIDPFVYPLCAFLLLAVPFRILCGWLGAAVCHEMGHVLAQCVLGGRGGKIIIRPMGAVIEGEDLGRYKNIISVLAGPAIGAVPMVLLSSYPEMALCSFFLTAYNLIPLYPLDGGRVLHLMSEKSGAMRIVVAGIETAVMIGILCMSSWYHTPVPLLPVIPYLREKYLAKRGNSGYNRATIEMR